MDQDNKKHTWIWLLLVLALVAIVIAVIYAIYHYRENNSTPSPSPSPSPSPKPSPSPVDFLILPSTNITGFNAPNMPSIITEDQCQALCISQDCVAYNFDAGSDQYAGCWIKQLSPDSDNILAFKNTALSTNKNRPYIRFTGQSMMPPSSPTNTNLISTYPNYSELECQTACTANKTCAYYNYDMSGSNCNLYNINPASDTDTGINLGAADSP